MRQHVLAKSSDSRATAGVCKIEWLVRETAVVVEDSRSSASVCATDLYCVALVVWFVIDVTL